MSLGISYQISAVDDISRTVKKIAENVNKMDKKIEKIGRTSKKSGKKTSRAFDGMRRSAGFLSGKLKGLAVAGAAFFGIKNVFAKGMEFEDAMASVAAITGAAGDELQGYSDTTIKLSKKYGIAAAEIAIGLKDIASGKSELLDTPDKLKEITDKAVELSRAAGITVPEAVRAMVSSLNQYGKGAESAARFSDILTQGQIVGASEIGETADALKNVGGIAFATGMDFATTNAALQAMSKGSIKAAEAGTGLAGIIRLLNKENKAGGKFAGLDIKKMGFQEVLRQLKNAADSGFDVVGAFGEHGKSIAPLIDNFKHFKSFTRQLKQESKGASAKSAGIRMATTSVRIAKLRMRLDVGMLKLFEKMQPLLTDLVEDFTTWIDNLKSADIASFFDTMSSIGTVLKNIGKLIVLIVDGWAKIFGFIGIAQENERAKQAAKNAPTMKDFTNKDFAEMSATAALAGGGGDDLSSQLPPGWSSEKNEIEITIRDKSGSVESVKQKGLGNGSKRKSKVKTNMSTE